MRVTVERSHLLKSLGHVHRVVERRNTRSSAICPTRTTSSTSTATRISATRTSAGSLETDAGIEPRVGDVHEQVDQDDGNTRI